MPKLTFIGHAAFLLDDDEGNAVAIDPFVEHNPATRLTARDITANTILLTHAHNDHVGDTVEIAKNNDAKVICVVELGDWLEEQGVRDVVGVNHGGTVGFAGGTVKIVPAWHSSSFTTENGVVAPGVPAGLVVRFGGRTFYFAGDTALFGDMQLIGELYSPDVALLPIGDRLTMGPLEAAHATRLLGVEHVVPIHYSPDVMPIFTGTPEKFQELVAEIAPNATVHVMEPGDDLAS